MFGIFNFFYKFSGYVLLFRLAYFVEITISLSIVIDLHIFLSDHWTTNLILLFKCVKLTANWRGLLLCRNLYSSARNRSPIEKLKLKLSTKADRYSSAGTEAGICN